ncbi:hypothetical protein CPT_Saba_022 [Proteus phage Saba]|uniref:DUF7609 domain-containing protein n=1 Tax=Proteus phage Saba TaxID=2596672 RepID=A0A5B9N9C1_9CAUD|nr:hypothetical protein JT320_gp22 [Proteus phage Saba]QEG09395.1 hypothetical protein CPT_Saba_022 [Proteus phage Saba]
MVKDSLFELTEGDKIELPAKSEVSPQLEREITAASSVPDRLPVVPTRSRASSMVGNLVSLEVGESYVRSKLVADLNSVDKDAYDLTAEKDKLRDGAKASIRHARGHTNGDYSMESTQCITPSGRVYVQIIITRTE